MTDRFDEIAAGIDASEGDHIHDGYNGAPCSGTCRRCAWVALIAATVRTAHDEAFEAGFECALEIAVASVSEYADAEGEHARQLAVAKDVPAATRIEAGTRATIRVNGIRAGVGAIRAARDRIAAERDRARGGRGT